MSQMIGSGSTGLLPKKETPTLTNPPVDHLKQSTEATETPVFFRVWGENIAWGWSWGEDLRDLAFKSDRWNTRFIPGWALWLVGAMNGGIGLIVGTFLGFFDATYRGIKSVL
ncbi:MAG: hypothetical protein R3C68_16660 [Myxococcota bacterium]